MSDDIHIGFAETDEERTAVFRFRYDIYVDEMGRYRGVADHERRLLREPEDDYSRIFYASQRGEVVATSRLTWGGDAPFPKRMIDQFGLAPFLAEVAAEHIAVGERGMIVPRLRGSDLLIRMMRFSGQHFVRPRRIQLIFGACEPHLLTGYLALGHRTYARTNINSSESGYLIPLIVVVEDVAHLRAIGSPLADDAIDHGADSRIPRCAELIIAEGGAVRSSRVSAGRHFWEEINGALDAFGGATVAAFDGLSEAEVERCLGKSNIIECEAGDRVLKKGGVARNMFVVLSGTLEARDGDAVVNVLSAGDIFGEMAFLLETPRSLDVYAATDGTRILSLSETTIRKLIHGEPTVAAHLLLNISKMLSLRLLKHAG